jgi:hypothetical protein
VLLLAALVLLLAAAMLLGAFCKPSELCWKLQYVTQ